MLVPFFQFFISLQLQVRRNDQLLFSSPQQKLLSSVLGLAEMELIFPVAALTVLCSVLVARKVLLTSQCFGCC